MIENNSYYCKTSKFVGLLCFIIKGLVAWSADQQCSQLVATPGDSNNSTAGVCDAPQLAYWFPSSPPLALVYIPDYTPRPGYLSYQDHPNGRHATVCYILWTYIRVLAHLVRGLKNHALEVIRENYLVPYLLLLNRLDRLMSTIGSTQWYFKHLWGTLLKDVVIWKVLSVSKERVFVNILNWYIRTSIQLKPYYGLH